MKNNYISQLHFISKHLVTLLVLALLVIGVGSVSGATYYSAGNDAPNLVASWWTNTDGTGAHPANFTTDGNIFVIQSGHTMTTTATWTVSGAVSTLQVDGTLVAANAVTATSCIFNNASIYEHKQNGGTIPSATWNLGSTCLISGYTNPGNGTTPTGIGQSFSNFTWNCPAQTDRMIPYAAGMQVRDNFNIISTGSDYLYFADATNVTASFSGNFIQSGGEIRLTRSNNNASISFAGDLTLSGGTLNIDAGNGGSTLNLAGNISLSGGTLRESGSGSGAINFNGTTIQTYSKSLGTISNTLNFAVNSGATLDVGTSIINGSSGTFTLNSGAGIITAHAQGLSTSGSTGSIQVTGAKTYNAGASYTYDGTVNQVTGNGLPTALTGNLTINNTGTTSNNIVTLSAATSVSGTFLLVNGILATTTTNLLSITNTTNSAVLGGNATSFVNGPIRWSLPSGLASGSTYSFPVGKGTAYLPFALVNPTTSGSTTAQVEAFITNSGGSISSPLTAKSTSEYWQLTTSSNFTNSSVSIGKSSSINPYNAIGGSTAVAGTYNSLAGTADYSSVNQSTSIGTNRFFVLANVATPTITISPITFGSFGYIFNFGPSTEQLFNVNGISLTADITITAGTDFEISKTSGTGFQTSLTLNRSGNNVPNTTIYIRLKAGLAVGNYFSENLTIESTGVSPKNIQCNGTVFSSTPAITTSGGRLCPPADQINLYSSSDNITILYWTGPNGFYSVDQNPVITPTTAAMNGTYTVTGSIPVGANLIINGDFESGNTGFSSSYTNSPTNLYGEGTYGVIASPYSAHGNFCDCSDHTPDPGTLQMVINGATTANVTVWSETVNVVPNSLYQFSYWLQSVNPVNPSMLQLFANGVAVGGTLTAVGTNGIFKQFIYNWNSGSSTNAVLELKNQNTIAGGNDFAIDDIIFRTVQQVTSSVNVTAGATAAVSISTPSTSVAAGTNTTFYATSTNGGTAPLYQWSVNNTNIGTNSSSSVFNYVPVNGDVITCVMTSNNSCTDPKTATSNSITMTVTGNKNYWIGAIGTGGTAWNDPNNWTATKVPASGDNVEFATTGNNSGVAAKNDLYVDYNRIVGSIINNASGKNLVIPADKEVVVNNLITLNPIDAGSTYDQIQIKCDPNPDDNSRLPNGSLIFPNATGVNGTVEMYSKSYIDNLATDDNQKYFWQYFGIPVETITAEPALYGAYVRKSNEAGDETDANYYWTELNNSSILNAFDGFEICQPTKTTYTFTGQLVNRSLNLPILPYSTGIDVKYRGENLLANPYTAAIDVNKMNFGTNVEAAVYLYNTGSYGQWDAATELGDGPGQYISIPKEPAGNNGLPQEVPSMSSMLIKATDVSNGGISFNYSDVIKKNETVQRVKSIDAISNTDLVSTMIDLTGLHYSDRMWIFSEPSCTRNFDNGWDGRKILGSSLAPQIFAIEPDGDYQVNSVSDMHNTDLAFQAGDEVEYTLKFTHENIQRQYAGVYLVDLVENKTVDVSQNGSTYTFATAQSDAPAKRFKILTRSYEKGAPDKEAQVKIFTAPGRVFVHNLSTFKGECTLYDIAGRSIKIAPFEANAVTEVLNNLTPGAYVVNTITNGEKVSKRVIVQ